MKTMTTLQSRVPALGVLLVTFISATIALTALAAAPTCVPAPPGLVGWWAGEANANDSAGANNGALYGGLAFAAGEVGQAFSFDGSSGYVKMPASASLDVGAGAGLTFECWIKPAALANAQPVAEWNNGAQAGAQLWISRGLPYGGGAGSICVNLVDTTGAFHTLTTGAGVLNTNRFQHVALSYDKASGLTSLYCNGALEASGTLGSFTPQTGLDLYLGKHISDAPFAAFGGLMDEASLYSRALTAAEIQAIYVADGAGKCPNQAPSCATPPAGLVSWWRGEGAAGDSAGTNNGVLEGGVAFAAGEVGQAFSFNGTNADIRVPASASVNVGLDDGFTIETWINPADITQEHPMVEWNNGSFGVHLWIAVAGNGPGSLWLNVKDTDFNDHPLSTAAGELVSNAWQHVAATYVRSSGSTVIYINGVAKAQATLGMFTPRTIGDLYIGVRPYDAGAGERYAGLMDEVSLYGRALSASDIQAIYNAGSSGKCGLPLGVAPSITAQPANQTVLAGSTATFSATAAGTLPLSYQWCFNGTNIAGATGTSLTLSNVQPFLAGNYAVLVTNAFGSITSSNALLAVCTPTSGLAVYYPFNGNAKDASGNGNDGTVHGATLTADRFGIANSAYSFNGVSSEILVPETIFGATNEAWTLSVWITTDSGPYSGDQQIYTKSCANGQAGIGILNGQIEVAIKTASQAFYIAAAPLLTNSTMHVVGVYQKGQSLSLYINGLLATNTPVSNEDLFVSSFPLISSLGSYHYTGGPYEWFRGTMDDFRVYTRALSASEVQQLYACESVTPPSSSLTNGLTAYYPFNGNASDASGNGNNGVVNGATLTADRFGSPNSAYRFNGTSWIQLPDGVEPAQPSGLTVSAWVQADSGANAAGAWLIHLSNRTGEGGMAIWNAGSWGAWVKLQNSYSPGYYANQDTAIPSVWTHIVAVYSQGQSVEYWVNGSLIQSNTLPNYPLYTDPYFPLNSSIGNYDYAPGPYNGFTGAMDDVRIYNRALAPGEVQALYQYEATPPDYPIITQQPQSQTVPVGSNVTFTVTASGRAPLSYQWRLRGTNLAGATGSALALANAQRANAGNYSVLVTNAFGSMLSSNAVLTVNPSSSCATAPPGLVSWWRGEGAAGDSAGANNGELEGGVAFAAGEVGQAFKFNGTNADVRVPASASLNVGLADGFTIETWINPADITQEHPLVEWNDGSFGVHLWIAVDVGAGPGSLWINAKDTDFNDHPLSTAAGLLVSNAWQHVAATYVRSNGSTVLYINGVARAQTTLGTFTPRTIGDLYIAVRPYDAGAGERFVGLMDEVSLYNRALSAAEIQDIYNAGSVGKCPLGVPPSIITQPANQTVVAGSNAAFSATVTGTSPLSYQWRFSGTNIAGATGTSLTLSNVQPAQAGSYSVLVTNVAGSVTSSNAVLTINTSALCAPPPAGLVSWWAGEGSANDSYGTNNGTLQGGMSFVPGKVGQAFSFNGTNAYVVVPASSSLNVGAGSGLTIETWIKPTDVSIAQPLVEWNGGYFDAHFWISFQSAGGLYANLVDTARIYHEFTSPSGLLTQGSYQHVALTYDKSSGIGTFFVNGGVVAQQNLGSFIPETDHSLYLGLRPSGGVVTRYAGQMDEVSVYGRALSAAEIQAIYNAGGAGKCPLGAAPTILTQPANQTVAAGSSATFTATAMGTPPLSYQWRFNGTNIAGAIGTSLTLSNVQLANAGTYSVVVTNLTGSVTSSNAQLIVAASSLCAPVPQGLVGWWRGEGNADDSVSGNNGTLVNGTGFAPGEVAQAFSFDGVQNCVTNAMPGLTNIRSSYTMEFWAWPKAARASTTEATLGTAGISGQRYAIFPNNYGGPAGAGAGVSVGTNGVSVFEHSASYLPSLLVYNATIAGWTHIAVVYSNRQPSLYLNGVLVRTGLTSGADSYPSTCLGEVGVGYGYYAGLLDEVSIYNRALSASEVQAIYNAGSAGKCTVPTGPEITTQPANQAVTVGGTASFTVTASGTPPLSYQWRFSGTNITGATGASLTLSDVQPDQAGSYIVVVANAYGSTNSVNALLTVNPPPPCMPPPSGLVGWWRGEGNADDSVSGNNGTLVNGTGFAPGEVAQAFSFDGVQNCVTNAMPGLTNIRSSYTMEFWAWPKAARASTSEATLGIAGIANQRYAIFPDNYGGPGGAGAGVSVGTNGVSVFEHSAAYLPSLLVYNATITGWTHIAVVYSNRQPQLYLNGVLVRTGLTSSANSYPSTCLGEVGIGYGYYAGLLDEVSIYNRALSASEIQAIYAADGTGKCPPGVAPTILTQPANQTVLAGSTATFTATAAGTSPLSYQWRFNGTNIAGATGTSLTLSNAQPVQSGNYAVQVANAYGSAVSSNAILTVSQAPGCTTPPAGLVSWWQGEGAAADAAGSNNGVLEGGVAFAAGEVGQAFSFDGTSADVRVPASASLNVGAGNGFTIEIWINPAEVSNGHPIVEWNSGIFGVNFWVAGASPGSLWMSVKSTGRIDHPLSSAAGLLTTNMFQHVAATYDKTTGNAVLYLDGVVVAQQNLGIFTPMTTGDLYFGLRPYGGGAGTRFVGLMDEVSLYDRALSAGQIQAIYNAGSAGKCLAATPPSISAQPASQTVAVGNTVAFTVTTGGTAPLSYQWRWNSTNLVGATGTSLILSNVQFANAGTYSVLVSNLAGSVTSSNAELTVNASSSCAPVPPGLVSWWRGEEVANDSAGTNDGVAEGGVAFVGGEVGQAFSFNGTNADVRVPASTSLNVGLADGFTIETWINPADVALGHPLVEWNNGSFGVHLWIAGASPGSLWFDVKDTTLHDHSFSTAAGLLFSNVWQHVAATYTKSNGNTLIYLNGVAKAQQTLGAFTARTIGDLYLGLRPYDGGAGTRFLGLMDEVSLYNRALSAAEIAAIYNADGAGKCPLGRAPTILTQPANQTIVAGSTVTFTMTVTGTPPFSYQWRFNGTNIAGATGTSLTLSNVQPAQAGNYAVLVTNTSGSMISSNAVLTVNQASGCTTPPAGLVSWWRGEGSAGDSAGTNNGVLEGSVAFAAGEVGQAFIFDGTSADVRVPASTSLNVGLADGFTIETWINPADVALGHPLVEWNNGSFGVHLWIAGASAGSLWFDVKDTTLHDHYFSTAAGLLVSNVWQHVAATYTKSNGNTVIYLNGVAKAQQTLGAFTARTIGDLYLGLRPYDGGAGTRFMGLMDEVSLYNRALSASEIQAVYGAGSAGKCLPGTMPTISTQPASQTVTAGSAVAFTVTAGGTAPLSYQWQFDGTNLAGATDTSLALLNVQSASDGSYSVLVTNAFGAATSQVATLTILVPTPQTLLNVNFAAYSQVKLGFAGTGQTASDFWNNYTAPFQPLASLSNLAMADGTATTVGLTVQNGAGHWAFTHPDLMYNTYCYSQNRGDITLTVTNLPTGQYNFYLYGHGGIATANTVFQLLVDGADYGNQPTGTTSDSLSTNWLEGAQYVVYRNVAVTNGGAPVTIKAHPGSTGDAMLNGMQISSAAAVGQVQIQRAQVVVVPSGSAGSPTQLKVRGAPSRVYVMQASTNLIDWVTIGLGATDTDGNVGFTDPNAAIQPLRFYRAVGQ